MTRTFRSIHTGPISICRLHRLSSGGKLLATGGTDGSVKVFGDFDGLAINTISSGVGLDSSVLHTQSSSSRRWNCLCHHLPSLPSPHLCRFCWGRSLLLESHHLQTCSHNDCSSQCCHWLCHWQGFLEGSICGKGFGGCGLGFGK